MKLLLIIVSFFMLNSCGTCSKAAVNESTNKLAMENKSSLEQTDRLTQDKAIVIYDSHTRGFHFTATVYNNYVTVVKTLNGKPEKIVVEQSEIDAVKAEITKITLDDIAKHEAPTKRRYFDGAPHTTITVFNKGEKYKSQTFDGGFPPKALEVLVNKVLSLSAEK